MEQSAQCQVLMATHSPLLMAYPGAQLLQLSPRGLVPVTLQETEHFALTRDFCADPAAFVNAALEDDS
jgi:predicted ATPase